MTEKEHPYRVVAAAYAAVQLLTHLPPGPQRDMWLSSQTVQELIRLGREHERQ